MICPPPTAISVSRISNFPGSTSTACRVFMMARPFVGVDVRGIFGAGGGWGKPSAKKRFLTESRVTFGRMPNAGVFV